MHYKNRWLVQATAQQMMNDPAVAEISQKLGVTIPTAQLLVNRGCRDSSEAENFLGKKEEQLHDPFLMTDMDKAAQRITEAIENKEKIVIFGDYDVDGVTSVSCLYLFLEKAGADVSYYIPCRSGEGYGMSENAVRKLADEGCRLIITVDTGITANAEAEILKELGVDLIVTDHHECHPTLPDAVAVVNPRRPDCPYPFGELAGVGVVFKLLCALESVMHPEDAMIDCVRRISKAYVDLVAIGTVADVMPVRDENRLIISYGLDLIENTERPGLIELIDATRTDSKYNTRKKITASFIGYTIAPRINAAGRIRDASIAVELFLAKDCETAAPIAKKLCDINRERQNEENKITDQAYAQIDANVNRDEDRVIVLDHETWHHGIIGIVASRITEKYSRPSILISFEGSGEDGVKDGEDLGKGSGRSIKGMNLVDALTYCSDLLEKFGGHELAAGLTIKRANLPEFRRRLNEYAKSCISEEDVEPCIEAECELTPADITLNQARELYYLEPYGVSNPVPLFMMKNLTLEDAVMVGGGKHTRYTLRAGKNFISAMFFRRTIDEGGVYPGDTVDVIFSLDINEFQNQKNLQMVIKDIRLSDSVCRREEEERELFAGLRDGKDVAADIIREHRVSEIVPDHSDFAAVYSLIRRELKVEHEIFTARALINLLSRRGANIGYVKLRYIMMIFDELGLIKPRVLDAERELYAFKLVYVSEKANLDSSDIYRKLKALFGQEI